MKDLDFKALDLKQRISLEIIRDAIIDLENKRATIARINTAPTSSNKEDLVLDGTGNKLYVKYADGTYKSTTLS